MTTSALGEALRILRTGRGLSVRELGTLADVDHAYVYRLETGAKEAPSEAVLSKLLRSLKASRRDAEIVAFLARMRDVDPALVAYALPLPAAEVSFEVFATAAGARHRGARPAPDELIRRAKLLIESDDGRHNGP